MKKAIVLGLILFSSVSNAAYFYYGSPIAEIEVKNHQLNNLKAGSFAVTRQFTALSEVKTITFEDTTIAGSIDTNAFRNLPHLEKISFKNTVINEIDFEAFSNLPKLESITFENVTIGSIQAISFHKLPKLKKIDFTSATFPDGFDKATFKNQLMQIFSDNDDFQIIGLPDAEDFEIVDPLEGEDDEGFMTIFN